MSVEKDYLNTFLSKFIKDEINKGHSLEEIKQSLQNFGHSSEVIEDAVNLVLGDVKDVKLDKEKGIEEDLFVELTHELVNYVKDNLKNKVPLNKIKSNLKNFGHDDKLIDKAIKKAIDTEQTKENKYNYSFLLYIIPVIFMFSVGENPMLIVFGFLPMIFFPLIIKHNQNLFLPLGLSLFHLVAMYVSQMFPHSILKLFLINLVLLYAVFFPFYYEIKKEVKPQKKLKPIKDLKINKKNDHLNDDLI